jgi:hypothetical protein
LSINEQAIEAETEAWELESGKLALADSEFKIGKFQNQAVLFTPFSIANNYI